VAVQTGTVAVQTGKFGECGDPVWAIFRAEAHNFFALCKFRFGKKRKFDSVKFVCCVSSSVVKKREKGSKNEQCCSDSEETKSP
jgi:hypothetical protein